MANELNIALDESGKSDVIAKVISSTSQVGSDIALSEIAATKVYSGDAPTLTAGIYTVRYEDTDGLIGVSELQWNGSEEASFLNIDVDLISGGALVGAGASTPVVQSVVDGSYRSSNNVIYYLYEEITVPIIYDIADYLTSIGETATDISNVYFTVKENLTDPDGVLYEKTLSSAEVTLDTSNAKISCLISNQSGMAVGQRYHIGIGVRFPSDLRTREVPVDKDLIEFKQDLFRQ